MEDRASGTQNSPMAPLDKIITSRDLTPEAELREVRSEGEHRVESWVHDYLELYRMNQKQLDFTDEVLVQLSQTRRELEQAEGRAGALQLELRTAEDAREQLEQTVKKLQRRVQEMVADRQGMEREAEKSRRGKLPPSASAD